MRTLTAIALTVLAVSSTAGAQGGGARTIKDIPYLENANYADSKDKLDLYLPEGLESFPVIFFLHGGGLLRGDKNGQGHVGARFASAGFGVVCPNYRLSPGFSHPAHIEDVAAAFAWVYRNIGSYGGEAKNIFVVGHSAGAYLAALLALDGRYLEAHQLSPAHIRGVVPMSGFFHVERLAPSRPKSVWGADEEGWLAASPSQYASSSAPPMLLLYADGDVPERRQESMDLSKELKAAGHSDVAYKEIGGRNHITIWQKLDAEDDATSREVISFARRLSGGSE